MEDTGNIVINESDRTASRSPESGSGLHRSCNALERISTLTAGILALVACSPVSVDDFGQDLETAVVIETAFMYEQLGIINEVRTQLASGHNYIVDSLMVYDEQGNLLTCQRVQSDVLGHVSLTVPDLTNGTYTFVLFQSCSLDEMQDCWTIVDSGQLSTLQIQHSDICLDGVQALGVAKELVSVSNGSIDVTLTPQAVGGIVDFQVDNYVKDSNDVGMGHDLPPLWLYVDTSAFGYYPDSGQYQMYSEQDRAIGYLEEGQSHSKFFMLSDGLAITASIKTDYGFVYYEDTISLPPGSNAACYYSFAPKSYYNAYFGTPKGLRKFKAFHKDDNCTLYPFLQWGASLEEVDHYVKNRSFLPGGDSYVFVSNDYTIVRYTPVHGLAEHYFFDPDGKLMEVAYQYDGSLSLEQVQSCMEKQGYNYLGSYVQEVFIHRLYLSADKLTELETYRLTDIIKAPGITSWMASFRPFDWL